MSVDLLLEMIVYAMKLVSQKRGGFGTMTTMTVFTVGLWTWHGTVEQRISFDPFSWFVVVAVVSVWFFSWFFVLFSSFLPWLRFRRRRPLWLMVVQNTHQCCHPPVGTRTWA